jgi:hypothetical protein
MSLKELRVYPPAEGARHFYQAKQKNYYRLGFLNFEYKMYKSKKIEAKTVKKNLND